MTVKKIHHQPADEADTDQGFGLIEILLSMSLLSMLLVPLSALIVTTVKTSMATERRATSEAILQTATSLIGRSSIGDSCNPAAVEALVATRVNVPPRYTLTVVPDCSEVASTATAIVTITITDPIGQQTTRQSTAVVGVGSVVVP